MLLQLDSGDEGGTLRIGGVLLRVDEEGNVLSRHRGGGRGQVQVWRVQISCDRQSAHQAALAWTWLWVQA